MDPGVRNCLLLLAEATALGSQRERNSGVVEKENQPDLTGQVLSLSMICDLTHQVRKLPVLSSVLCTCDSPEELGKDKHAWDLPEAHKIRTSGDSGS